jgi:Down syndrome cell adhesion protein 1
MVNNKYGQDMVVHELIVNGPPEPPNVSISAQTTNSVTLKLRPKNPEDKTPVHGYNLNFKAEFGDWNTEMIPFGTEEYSLDDLLCGKDYSLFVAAYNR